MDRSLAKDLKALATDLNSTIPTLRATVEEFGETEDPNGGFPHAMVVVVFADQSVDAFSVTAGTWSHWASPDRSDWFQTSGFTGGRTGTLKWAIGQLQAMNQNRIDYAGEEDRGVLASFSTRAAEFEAARLQLSSQTEIGRDSKDSRKENRMPMGIMHRQALKATNHIVVALAACAPLANARPIMLDCHLVQEKHVGIAVDLPSGESVYLYRCQMMWWCSGQNPRPEKKAGVISIARFEPRAGAAGAADELTQVLGLR